jgi:hypothetical protein
MRVLRHPLQIYCPLGVKPEGTSEELSMAPRGNLERETVHYTLNASFTRMQLKVLSHNLQFYGGNTGCYLGPPDVSIGEEKTG